MGSTPDGPTLPPVVLRPVLAAADRMRTSVRLGVLVLVLMIPGIAATYSYTSEVNSKIAFSALERDGTRVVRPALLAMADTVAELNAYDVVVVGIDDPTINSPGCWTSA